MPLLLFILLVGSFWFFEKLTLDAADRDRKVIGQEPDYSVDDFTTVVMDEKGLPKRRLQAKRMLHYSMDGASELAEPYLVFFAVGTRDKFGRKTVTKSPFRVYSVWHAKSDRGRVEDDGKTILLSGKVHMWKNDDTGTMELDIRTRDLKILPDAHYGETSEATVIRTVSSETRSVGMRAHIKPARMELLSRVQTILQKNDTRENDASGDRYE